MAARSSRIAPSRPPVPRVALAIARRRAREPAAVAPGRAEAGVLGLDHGHPQRRVRETQVVRRPEARVAGADDRDVDVEIARERRPARGRSERGLPEPALAVPHSTKKRPVSPPPYQRVVTVVLRV